jgi:hypothetical protein
MAARQGDFDEGSGGQSAGGREPLQPLLVTANRGRDAETLRDAHIGFDLSGEVALHRKKLKADQAGKPQPCMRDLPGQRPGPDNQSRVELRSFCPPSAVGRCLNGFPVEDWSHAFHLIARLT